ncbi:M12 family metallo-peptidase [Flavobacterium sp. SM2513]|uniref:M12 family metallo-peptidase n=1 Tax=Flavobacterium sp. SM2513 TaxID=3424766 RepID=UPI003D7F382B
MTLTQNIKKSKVLKSVFLSLSLLSILNGFGQNKIAEEVQKLQRENTQFTQVSLLTADSSISNIDINQVVTQSTLAKVDFNKMNQIALNPLDFLELEIPYQNQNIKILLYRVNPFSKDFKVDTDKEKNISYQKGVYYRGIIKGNSNSVSAFNFFNGAFNGVFSSAELGNVVVGKIDKPNNQNDYIIYSDANFLIENSFKCGVEETGIPPSNSTVKREVTTAKCVTFYYEIDYNLFLSNDSNSLTTANWATSVFNNVQTLFANDGITTALNSVYIWTTPDAYEGIGTTSADYLFAFQDYRPIINGDVGVLVGIDPGGLGGVAFLNGLCTNFNYGYSDVDGISIATVPTYSWTTQVMTHELGHLLGSPHTHACVWNGNNTPIDGCGSQAGYPENGCNTIGPIPSSFEKGTIMSYCHLIEGVGISFANGFGIQPATLMANTINAKSCLGTNCIACINTISNIQTSSILDNSTTITWEDFDDATSWEISVTSFGSPAIWNVVSQTNYQATGLLPNTYYQIKIKPICTSVNPISREYLFITPGNYCGTLSFYDTGGDSNNYSDIESFTRTITPNLSNKKIVVSFTEFNLEDNYDYLYIYDGSDDSYAELNFGDGFTGTNSPGTVTSTAVDGSLTFKFISDQYSTASGWSATINCEENLGIGFNDFLDFTYYPNPTKNNINLKSNTNITEIKVYNIEGRTLFSQKLNALESNVDLSQFASGTYFFKVRFNEIEKNFKILKM